MNSDNADRSLLIVDDEESMCQMLSVLFRRDGWKVTARTNPVEALELIKGETFHVVITDLKMPQMNGIEFVRRLREVAPATAVILITAFATVNTAIEALRLGAADYLTKPFKNEEIRLAVDRVTRTSSLVQENRALKQAVRGEGSLDLLIGDSAPMLSLKDTVRHIAPTDSTVLISGESGVGKELVARAIHALSPRAEKAFVTINCGALPESLLESELFGYLKGSFTGAIKDKEGLFKAADGGTFFLDEVGETSLNIQVKLLRVLQESEFLPVGSTKPVHVDIRLLAATNANLGDMVSTNRFRADLYYRLNVFPVRVPPLRERIDDIPILIKFFMHKSAERLGLKEKKLTAKALDSLCHYAWPGNVRELENCIERILVYPSDHEVGPDALPEFITRPQVNFDTESQPISSLPTLEIIEKAYIFYVLTQSDWQKNRAAQILGIDASTLYRKIEKYQLVKV